ncbi:MAG: phosphoribosylglycinamide formyltransferase [Chitinivibrionales bacterium]|nr:phosphoribosylglycinamide formyltransferase [Chitinivibrionales bacterium]
MSNCAVFLSGGGSNFQALIDRKNSGDLHVDFTVCISNNSKAYGCERARKNGIPVVHLARGRFGSNEEYTARLLEVLSAHSVEMIVCAGYMKIIPAAVVEQYRNKILNIHPALLPSFGGKGMYGKRVHQAVLDHGAKVSGITVHLIDEQYDSGPIVLQECIPVPDTDDAESLAGRVLALEHAHYWRAVEAVAQNRLTITGRRVTGEL